MTNDKIRVEFSKDELFEIEKAFDITAWNTKNDLAISVERLGKLPAGIKRDLLIDTLLSQAIRAYDQCRTISAICQKARNDHGQK